MNENIDELGSEKCVAYFFNQTLIHRIKKNKKRRNCI